jgi:ABC-type sulfate/molybdate transport systems ATPase subunit
VTKVPPADDVVLRCEHLSVRRGHREVVRDVSIELHSGEVVALLGPNGAGKSTLMEALAGSLPLSSGAVERSGRVGLALQSPDLARRSVTANIELALSWWGVPRVHRRERTAGALAAMKADHLARRAAASLSGGERRRVHLARAVSVRPDVLLLDEPFAGLDAATRGALLDDTGEALRAWTTATLVVVHDRAEAWALADRLLVLIDGRLVANGFPRELLERPPTVEVARFLGFDGTLSRPGGEILLTRAHHVALDPAGPVRARVTRSIPLEDGVRLELTLDEGKLYAVSPLPGPVNGDEIGVRVTGGVTFPRVLAAEDQDAAALGAGSAP